MDKAIKEDWLEALRSGEYVQTEDKLEDALGRNCCLGVLCDIQDVPKHTLHFGYQNADPYYEFGFGLDRTYWSGSDLPTKFRRDLGITREQEAELIRLNDEVHATFEEIAEYIEVTL